MAKNVKNERRKGRGRNVEYLLFLAGVLIAVAKLRSEWGKNLRKAMKMKIKDNETWRGETSRSIKHERKEDMNSRDDMLIRLQSDCGEK